MDTKDSSHNSGGDSSQNQSGNEKAFLEYFPEDIRGEKTLEKFSGANEREVIGKLGKSYVNLEKMHGSSVRIPGEKATKEEIAAFRSKLGVPEAPDKYGVDLSVVNEMKDDAAAQERFLAWAHEQGFTKKQLEGVIARYVEATQAKADARTTERADNAAASMEEISKVWGHQTDRNVALVQRAVREMDPGGFADYLEETGLGNDPRFLQWTLRMAEPMLNSGLIKGENLGMKAGDAQAEINKLMTSDAYKSKDRTVREPVIERIRELTDVLARAN